MAYQLGFFWHLFTLPATWHLPHSTYFLLNLCFEFPSYSNLHGCRTNQFHQLNQQKQNTFTTYRGESHIKKENCQTLFMRLQSPRHQNHTDTTKKENYKPISLMNMDAIFIKYCQTKSKNAF